jgi:hypothetical protein
MNKSFAHSRWWDFGPILLGLSVIANLVVATGNWYSWIFPTGIVAAATTASGLRGLFRKMRPN